MHEGPEMTRVSGHIAQLQSAPTATAHCYLVGAIQHDRLNSVGNAPTVGALRRPAPLLQVNGDLLRVDRWGVRHVRVVTHQ
jgi:hypothetical protein